MNKHWWDNAVAYQIYPRSFQDSNGDGIGDIKGITKRLDYLSKLGIGIVWLSPLFKSPMVDGGYDISDYEAVDPMFGTNEDLEELLAEAKKRNIKILLDMVLNHSSDEHPWFKEAMKDPLGKAGDRYIIRKGINGKAPNNWRAYFGGSVWEPISNTDLYYFHAFDVHQPDLNWENEALRKDIFDMMNRWCKKGVAGFRIDAIGNIKKNLIFKEFEPDGIDGLVNCVDFLIDQKGIDDYFEEMKKKVFKPNDCFTVAEVGVEPERLNKYIGEEGFFTTLIEFSYADIDIENSGDWLNPKDINPEEIREKLFKFQTDTQKRGLAAPHLENHDQPRSANKFLKTIGTNDYGKKMLAMLFMLMRGVPFIYQGQEIGMENINMESIKDYNDIATIDQYNKGLREGLSKEKALKLVAARSRDNSRTPMQWDTGINASFSSGKTWLPVNPNYKDINVEDQINNENSVFNFYKKLIELRTKSEYSQTLIYGDFVPMEFQNDYVMPYMRVLNNEKLIVLINYSNKANEYKLPEKMNIILSNYNTAEYNGVLKPYQCILMK